MVQIQLETLAHLQTLLVPITRTHTTEEDCAEEEEKNHAHNYHAHDEGRLLVEGDISGFRGEDSGGGLCSIRWGEYRTSCVNQSHN